MAAKVLNTINNRLKFLYRKQKFLSLSLRRLLCNALIQPHFDYACAAWYPLLNKRQSKRIPIAQNKCIRYCLNLDNKARIGTNEFLKINWLPTKKRVEQCICVNVFNFFNQMSPQYTAEIFHPSSSVHNTCRATQKLDLPFRKSCIGQKTLSYIGPKTWNNLPDQIKLSKNVNTFKHDIKKSFFDDLQNKTTIYSFIIRHRFPNLLYVTYLHDVLYVCTSSICFCSPKGTIMKIRSTLTCIMLSLPQYLNCKTFRCVYCFL